jgi:fermentation-respiration switch protein FrsA (DUF1100 family)
MAGSFLSAPANEPVGSLPTDLVGNSVQFQSESGTTLHGWLIPGRKGMGAVVLMHGVRANRLSMLDRARFLARAGFTVLLFDFQAHGESPGTHVTFGYLESRDARAAVDYVRANVPGEKVGVIGVSMGGAAALLAEPVLDVEAIVLEMVYPTANQAIGNRLIARFGRAGKLLIPLLTWQLKPRLGVGADDLRPIDKVGRMTMPKLFIAGSDDKYTPLAESQQMFETASNPKDLWIVNGAGHQDLYRFMKSEYEQRILTFFSRYLRNE